MAQSLQDIKGGGGSIKLGTTGTISALMSRELESAMPAHKVPSFTSGEETSRIQKLGTSANEASSSSISSTGSSKNHKGPENWRKQGTTHIPMLRSESSGGLSVNGTPVRKKPVKKHAGIVEIVDIRCGNPDKTWVKPITQRLKKLGFSKLSDSVV